MECYNCSHPLEGHEDTCPGCGKPLAPCENPDCAKLLPVADLIAHGGEICPFCGTDLPGSSTFSGAVSNCSTSESDTAEILGNDSTQKPAAVVELSGAATHMQAPGLDDDAAAGLSWPALAPETAASAALPTWLGLGSGLSATDLAGGGVASDDRTGISIEFLIGKRYQIGQQDYLDFRIGAVSQSVRQVAFSVSGSDGFRRDFILSGPQLTNGMALDDISFTPQRAGEERLQLHLTVFMQDGQWHRLEGRASINVKDKAQATHIDSGGGDIVIAELGAQDGYFPELAEEMVVVPLKPLSVRSEKPTVAPPDEYLSNEAKYHGPLRFVLRNIRSGERTYIVMGDQLRIGRSSRSEDWTPRFGIGRDADQKQRRIGRHHVSMSIRTGYLQLTDGGSQIGVKLDGVKIPSGHVVMLDDDATMELAGVLPLAVKLIVQNQKITAVILLRQDEPGGFVSRVVLLNHWVALAEIDRRCKAGWLIRGGPGCILVQPSQLDDETMNVAPLAHGAPVGLNGIQFDVEALIRCISCEGDCVPVPDSDTCGTCRGPITRR